MPEDIKKETIDNETAENKAEEILKSFKLTPEEVEEKKHRIIQSLTMEQL